MDTAELVTMLALMSVALGCFAWGVWRRAHGKSFRPGDDS